MPHWTSSVEVVGGPYLEVLPRREGEEGQLSLLLTPGLAQVRVPDEHARLHAGVQVQGDVLRPAVAEVHREAGRRTDTR